MHQQSICQRIYDIENCPFCDGQPGFVARGGNAFGFKCTCKGKRFIHTYFDSSIPQDDMHGRIASAVKIWNEQAARKPEADAARKVYRMLSEGEVMKVGDEGLFADGVTWKALDESAMIIGLRWAPGFHNPIRRLVTLIDDCEPEAPRKYERVAQGACVQAGDEMYEYDTGEWRVLEAGHRSVGKRVGIGSMIPYRRLTKTAKNET